jgi:hypothetical protein
MATLESWRGADTVPILIGIAIALATCVFASLVGLDRDRAFYPTVLCVTVTYYALYAVMSGSMRALLFESVVVTGFFVAAVAGFRSTLWLVVAGLAGHGLFDVVHHQVISNPGVPAWWPSFCLAFDIAAALCLGWLLTTGRVKVR